MKKTLVSALTGALVLGAAATTFAAANPFEDVPADHWAYDAVAQLAADGVIEGYGDGTFRGDRDITRYEMAQMVARAMAKGNLTTANKAIVDKLAAEFSAELNNLGVRVAALEKKVDNVKWNGTVRYRYISDRIEEAGVSSRTNSQYMTLRLEPNARINEHWTGHARIDYNTDMNTAKNSGSNTDFTHQDGESDLRVERIWVDGIYGNTNIKLGKLPYVTQVDRGMLTDSNVSGMQVTFGKNVKVGITLGRFNLDPDKAIFKGARNTTASYQGIEIYNDRAKKFTWGVGYHHFILNDFFRAQMTDNEEKALNIWALGLGYKFDKNVSVQGAYAWNTAPDSAIVGSKNKKSWSIEVDYKNANPAKKGSFGAFVAYRHLGGWVSTLATYDTMTSAQKGWEFGFDYIPMKNVKTTLKYFTGKDMDNVNTDENASALFGEINFFF